MAKRRSFSERVLGSDAFCALSDKAQLLYIALSMAADDEGMIGAPLRLSRSIGAGEEELSALAGAGYLIRFESGVCAVTHFHENNYIHPSRRRETEYLTERGMLTLTPSGRYVPRRTEVRETDDAEPAEEPEEEAEAEASLPLACDLHANCMHVQNIESPPPPSPPFPPSSFSPCTPLSITPYDPPQHTPIPLSSSSGGARVCERYAAEFWGRGLRPYERDTLRYLIARQRAPTEEDRDELLRYAFLASARAGRCNLAYLGGVYRNWEVRGIRTVKDYAEAEFERDKESGRL